MLSLFFWLARITFSWSYPLHRLSLASSNMNVWYSKRSNVYRFDRLLPLFSFLSWMNCIYYAVFTCFCVALVASFWRLELNPTFKVPRYGVFCITTIFKKILLTTLYIYIYSVVSKIFLKIVVMQNTPYRGTLNVGLSSRRQNDATRATQKHVNTA